MVALLDAPVLVLNGNFEPLNVCSTPRALALIVEGKAEVLQNGRGVIRTVAAIYPAPSVIRINYIVHHPLPRLQPTRREIFRRDNYRCQYCGREIARPTVDHILSVQRGGKNSWHNLVTACPECNVRKGARTPEEAHMPLLSFPSEPRPTALYRFGRYLGQFEEWRSYLEGW